MTRIVVMLLVAAVMACAGQAFAQQALEMKNLGAGVRRELAAAQADQKAGDMAAAKARIIAARSLVVNVDERWVLGILSMQVGQALGDKGLQGQAVDDLLMSGRADPAMIPKLLEAQAVYALEAKDAAKGIAASQKLIAIDPANANARVVLTECYMLQGQLTAADSALEQGIALKRERGEPVPESWTNRQVAIRALMRGDAPVVAAPAPALAAKPVPIAPKVAGDGPRLALVIGNADYRTALGALPNPANDATLIAAALRATGFRVDLLVNADQRLMKQAIARFGQTMAAAGRGATGLFYYAGHGVQARGVNYLVPVGADLKTEADLDLDAVAADAVLRQMEDAGATTSIVILDACRNMPLARSTRSASRGLARMDAPNGSYIAYSTAPGQEAADGNGRNSPFAIALANEMKNPGQPIETLFRKVRNSVFVATGGKQTPWDSSSLFDSFQFLP